MHILQVVVWWRTRIRKITFFGARAFDNSPHCHYGRQTRTIITIITPLLFLLYYRNQDEVSKSRGNRKWLHYGLTDRREWWSLVTALASNPQIPRGFRESWVTPWAGSCRVLGGRPPLSRRYLGPGAFFNFSAGTNEGIQSARGGVGEVLMFKGSLTIKRFDSLFVVILRTCKDLLLCKVPFTKPWHMFVHGEHVTSNWDIVDTQSTVQCLQDAFKCGANH